MNKKNILSVTGVVILGALGSGLWELISPLFGWVFAGILTITTLGLDSLRDGMYEDAANTIVNKSEIGLGIQLLAALGISVTVLVIVYLELSFRPVRRLFPRLIFYFLVFGSVSLTIAVSRTAYINKVVSFYTKLETIAAPLVPEAKLKEMRASYVQVTNKAAYVTQIEAMQKAIEAAGGKAPNFDFF